MTTTTDVPLGTRVVVRYRLPAGGTHSLTDVIGELITHEPVGIRRADGSLVTIDPDLVVATKPLGPKPVRPTR